MKMVYFMPDWVAAKSIGLNNPVITGKENRGNDL
jgi:hypothetical protein